MSDLTIRIASHQEYLDDVIDNIKYCQEKHPTSVPYVESAHFHKEETRREMLAKFPYSVVMEGFGPYLEFASRWLWANVSPPDGKCGDHHQEYPGCPLVLATKTWRKYSYKTREGVEKHGRSAEYHDPGEHSHEGEWTGLCMTKTGYDCFLFEYFFLNEKDRERFLAALPEFQKSENFDNDEDEEMTATETVHKSKWGYHPVSRAVSQKLRFLNGVLSKAQHKAAAWRRWDRKLPHNRVQKPRIRDANGRVIGYRDPQPLVEPELCPVFSEKVTKKVTWHPTKGYHKDGIDYTTVETSLMVREAAFYARTPVASPELVKPLSLSLEEIDRLYAEAQAWMGR